jgi:hypothetical protein
MHTRLSSGCSASDIGGFLNGSATSGSEYPSEMLPLEAFNDTLTTVYSNCGNDSSNSSQQPLCSTKKCTSADECRGNKSFPACLKTCGPNMSGGYGSGSGSAPGMKGNGDMNGSGSGMGNGNVASSLLPTAGKIRQVAVTHSQSVALLVLFAPQMVTAVKTERFRLFA